MLYGKNPSVVWKPTLWRCASYVDFYADLRSSLFVFRGGFQQRLIKAFCVKGVNLLFIYLIFIPQDGGASV